MRNRLLYTLDARPAARHFPGIGRYISSLSEALVGQLEATEQVQLLVDPAEDTWPLPEHTKIRQVPAPFPVFGLRQQTGIPPLIHGSAVYHSPYFLMPYRTRVPTVLTVYDLIPILFPETVSLRARVTFLFLTRLALWTADHVIAISEATRKDLLKRFPRLDPGRVTAIPLAPAARFSPQSPEAVRRVRASYDLPDDFCLYVGINKPHKNLVRLIEAWGRVDADMPLVIAGVWDERYPEARAAADLLPLGRVQFVGPIKDDDLPALYTACRLFVFPSLHEGFGLPVVEALACGAAVVCSHTSSLPEVGGDAVVYFSPHDIDAMVTAVRSALERGPNPERSLEQAARFSWERTAKATIQIYRTLARTHRL